jgi:hypothetical protein
MLQVQPQRGAVNSSEAAGAEHLPGGGCSSVRSVRSMPRTLRSTASSSSTGRSALLPAA